MVSIIKDDAEDFKFAEVVGVCIREDICRHIAFTSIHWILCLLWLRTCLYNWIWSFGKILNPPGPAEFTLSLFCMFLHEPDHCFPGSYRLRVFSELGACRGHWESWWVLPAWHHGQMDWSGQIRAAQFGEWATHRLTVNGSNSDKGRSFYETKLSPLRSTELFLEGTACCLVLKCWSTEKKGFVDPSSTCLWPGWMRICTDCVDTWDMSLIWSFLLLNSHSEVNDSVLSPQKRKKTDAGSPCNGTSSPKRHRESVLRLSGEDGKGQPAVTHICLEESGEDGDLEKPDRSIVQFTVGADDPLDFLDPVINPNSEARDLIDSPSQSLSPSQDNTTKTSPSEPSEYTNRAAFCCRVSVVCLSSEEVI